MMKRTILKGLFLTTCLCFSLQANAYEVNDTIVTVSAEQYKKSEAEAKQAQDDPKAAEAAAKQAEKEAKQAAKAAKEQAKAMTKQEKEQKEKANAAKQAQKDAKEKAKESKDNAQSPKKLRIAKQLEIVEAFKASGSKPEWMIIEALPVLPPDLRPMVPLDGG